MNERIRELAEQAGWMMSDEVEGFNTRLEKFTELIIKECIQCINNTDKNLVFTAQSAGIVIAAYNRSITKIKDHFGVEE